MIRAFVVLCVLCLVTPTFSQPLPDPEPPQPPDQWGHTFSTTLNLAPGETADLYALLPAECSTGWARITGKCKINGMETDFVSWARPGKCIAEAVEACTIEVWGK